jgi:hypothetical protein
MSQKAIREYLQIQQTRYQNRPGRKARSLLLDECMILSGLGRKHLIKVLGGRLPVGGQPATGAVPGRGRPPAYGAILPLIKALWLVSEQPCGKRLKPILREWVPYWEKAHGALPAATHRLLRRVSPAQLDRLLAPHRASAGRRNRGLGGDGTLKAQVPLRTGPWEVSGPGWTEIDSVAHCGGSMSGSFWWTTTLTDISTGWTQQYPAWNKGQHTTAEALQAMEKGLPFPLLGVDSDNGPEFLNWHLLTLWRDRIPAIEITRSRPYHKNDNAHIEQKNRTHVRELLGEERLDDPDLAPLLVELHTLWSDFHNFFLPTLKLLKKERHHGRIKKIYEPEARTPCRRLLEDGPLSGSARIALIDRRSQLNPFTLKSRAEHLLQAIWRQQADFTSHKTALTPEAPAQEGGGVRSGSGNGLPAAPAPCAPTAPLLRAS